MKQNKIIIKTEGNNHYLYSPRKEEQPLLLHPVLAYLLSKNNLKNWRKEFGHNQYIKIKDYGLCSIEEMNYYYKKLNFYKKNGFLDKAEYILEHAKIEQIQQDISTTVFLAFEITENCNLKCEYCSLGSFYSDTDGRHSEKRLNIDTAKKIIDYIFIYSKNNSTESVFSISFYGGEALTCFDFIEEIVSYTKKTQPQQRFRYNMTTNGLLLHKYADYLVENNFDLLISIDGNEKHNAHRINHNGESSFSKVFENIINLKSKYPEYFENYVNLNAVIHPENREAVETYLLKFFEKKPMISEIVDINVKKERETEFYNKFYGKHKEEVIFDRVTLNRDLDNFGYSFDSYIKLFQKRLLKNPKTFSHYRGITCRPFQTKFFVTTNQEILPCEKINHKFALGNIVDKEGKIFIDTELMLTKTNEKVDISKKICDRCFNLNCQVCLHSIEDMNDFTCEYYLAESDNEKRITNQINNFEKDKNLYLKRLN